MGWRARVVYVVLPLIPAVTGTAIAIRFNNSGDDWMTALLGWAAGWIFSLMAIAGWEVVHGRPIFGQQDAEQPQWRRAEVIALAVVLVAAALLRVVALESYPIALHNDEMSCLLEARGFLGADKGLFTVGWFNCPNLGFFLTSLPIRIFLRNPSCSRCLSLSNNSSIEPNLGSTSR